MVNVQRKAIESLYVGRCDIYQLKTSVSAKTKRTTRRRVKTVTDQPCRVSYNSSPSTNGNFPAQKSQTIKLFIAPELNIKAGSCVDVTQNGRTVEYEASGEPAVYTCHQEIELRLRKDKA